MSCGISLRSFLAIASIACRASFSCHCDSINVVVDLLPLESFAIPWAAVFTRRLSFLCNWVHWQYAMNSQFHSQLRWSCDCKLTRNRTIAIAAFTHNLRLPCLLQHDNCNPGNFSKLINLVNWRFWRSFVQYHSTSEVNIKSWQEAPRDRELCQYTLLKGQFGSLQLSLSKCRSSM